MTQPSFFPQFDQQTSRPSAPSASPVRQEKIRLNKLALKVLERLQQGPATNDELNQICFRYGARLLELRKDGWRITTQLISRGHFRYTLHGLKSL